MHDSLQGATFHVGHVIPRCQGGETRSENLAWACPRCNLCKSDRAEAKDPQTGEVVRLFHPRYDRWNDHFCFRGYTVIGITDIGRATAAALDFNHPRRVRIRQVEERFNLFPPEVT